MQIIKRKKYKTSKFNINCENSEKKRQRKKGRKKAYNYYIYLYTLYNTHKINDNLKQQHKE